MAGQERIYQVNLEELIEKYVWNRFKEDKGLFKGLYYRRNKHYLDVRWGYVDFKHKTETTERPSDPETSKRNVELYYSEYENETGTSQQYKFSTSRSTVATTRMELQETYTIGAETNLEVDLGGVVKFGGGINGSMSVTDTKGEEFSETLTWNIDTDITVPKCNKARATLYVYERPIVCDFTVKTTVSLPNGKLPVSIRRIADDKIIQTYWITNLKAIVSKDIKERSSLEIDEVEDPKNNKIHTVLVLTTHGVCKNTSWKNQHVKVQCEEIGDTDISKDVVEGAADEDATSADEKNTTEDEAKGKSGATDVKTSDDAKDDAANASDTNGHPLTD